MSSSKLGEVHNVLTEICKVTHANTSACNLTRPSTVQLCACNIILHFETLFLLCKYDIRTNVLLNTMSFLKSGRMS